MSGNDIDPSSADSSAAQASERPVPADVGRELQRLRAGLGETQVQTALAVGVSRANLAQWESGRYLPSGGSAQLLDEHFHAGNTLVELVSAAQSARGVASAAGVNADIRNNSMSLLDVFQWVGRSLAGYLLRDEAGSPIGWRHNLQQDQHLTALSTAYGIKAMLVVGEPYVDFEAISTSLLAMRSRHGDWHGRLGMGRPEVTATVLDALFRVGTTLPVEDALALTERSLDRFSKARPYLLSTVLRTVLRLRPDSSLAMGLINDLLSTRRDLDGVLLWPQKTDPDPASPEPSALHTAQAVVALREALVTHDRDDIRDAIGQATRWLVADGRPDDGTIEELVRPRPDGHGSTRVAVRHFTAAWIVQALAGADVPPPRLHSALRTLWSRYDRRMGLWAWGNGDLPIWMTFDSVTALRAAALSLATPLWRPTEEGP